jgi:hypothetical protein
MIKRTILNAVLGVVAMSMTLSVLAVDSFTLTNRSRTGHAERDGDVPSGAIIRTDERYNRDSLFYGPRGWDYWNLLQNPQALSGSEPLAGQAADLFLRPTSDASWKLVNDPWPFPPCALLQVQLL